MIRAGFLRPLTVFVAGVAFAGLGLAAPGGAAHPRCAGAAGAHHVAVVVQHGGGAVLMRCVAFDGASLTGEQVMQLSGVEYATAAYGGGMGNAVCQVDYEPASYPPGCWTSTSPYWAMFVSRGGGAWGVSSRGISTQTFADGDALGWHYQPQTGPGGGPPPSPAGACAAAPPPPPPPAATAPPAPAAPGPAPAPSAEAVPPAPTATPLPTGPAPASRSEPSPAVPATASPARARPAAAGSSVDLGIAAAAAGAGVLAGLLVLQVVGPRLRR